MLFYLMHENTKLLMFDVSVTYNIFAGFCIEKIFNKIPAFVKGSNDKTTKCLFNWFMSRYYDSTRPNFHNMSNQIGQDDSNRNYRIQYSLSLYTYGASLTDHYWFNPVEPEFIDKGISDSPHEFMIYPTTWEKVRKNIVNFSNDIGDIMEQSIMEPEKIRYMEKKQVNLQTADFALPGVVTKRWVKINDEIYCKKIFTKDNNGIIKAKMQIEISQYLKEIHSPFYLEYIKDDKYENIVYSKLFLNDNEEFINVYMLLNCFISDKRFYYQLYKAAKMYECNKWMIIKYINTIKKLEKRFGCKYNIENIGIVIDSNTGKCLRPAPIFGTFKDIVKM